MRKHYNITLLCEVMNRVQKEDTRERLLFFAKQEFLEVGYQKSSLRKICKNAGVTTGALYFFFKAKADLFDALVRDFADEIMTLLKEHSSQEEAMHQKQFDHTITLDISFGKELISTYYAHQDIGQLLINCSQGTVYEDYFEQIRQFIEARILVVLEKLLDFPNPVFNECTLHWLSHLQVHSFLHVLSHNYSEEKALQQIEIVVTFLRNGFNSLMEEALLRK